jgi:hypothetical protein
MSWQLFPKPEKDDPAARYVVTWTERPPLKNAGVKHRTKVQGTRAKNDLCRTIREGHGQVLRAEKRGWLW